MENENYRPEETTEAEETTETEATAEPENAAEPEKAEGLVKGKKASNPALVGGLIAIVLALLAAGLFLIIRYTNKDNDEPKQTETRATTQAATETPASTQPSEDKVLYNTVVPPHSGSQYGKNAVTDLGVYAVSAASPDSETMLAVVAQNGDGEDILNNAQFQLYYWMEFYQMMESYGDYVLYFGLNPNASFAGQASLAENMTWEQYFVDSATHSFANYYALSKGAEAAGYELPQEAEEYIASLTDEDGDFAAQVKENGFASADEYIKKTFGDGADLQDYIDYLRMYYYGVSYYNNVLYGEPADALTDAEIEKYYTQHSEEFTDVPKVNNVNVRHILITPEEQNSDGTYTDEAWAAAEQKANELLAQWQKDPTEENFAALANQNSDDPGSNTTGGLYEEVRPGQMVTEFDAWCFDTDRKVGDAAIVKTTYGYHIMFFAGYGEGRYWVDKVRSAIAAPIAEEAMNALKEKYPVLFDYTQLRVFDLASASATAKTE